MSNRKSYLALILAGLLLWQPQLLFAQTAASNPIKRDSLLEVLRRNLLSTRDLVKRIEQRGVAFQLTSEDEAQFRQAGARPEVLAAVRENYRGAVVAENKPIISVKPAASTKAPETKNTQPGALGIATVTLTREMSLQAGMNGLTGAMVRVVAPSGAAAQAGIRPGDVITQFNGKPVVTETLQNYVAKTPAGTKVYLMVMRQNRFENVAVTLGAMPANKSAFTYDDLTDQSLAALQRNDWDLAGNLLTDATRMNPSAPLAYSLLGYTYLYGRGDAYNAEQAMRAAIERGGSATFEVWHAQGSSFKDAVRGSLFIGKSGVIFKSSLSTDEFNVNDTEIKDAALNGFFGREHNAFHLEVRLPNGKTRNYNFAPRTANQLEALLILNLILSY